MSFLLRFSPSNGEERLNAYNHKNIQVMDLIIELFTFMLFPTLRKVKLNQDCSKQNAYILL